LIERSTKTIGHDPREVKLDERKPAATGYFAFGA